MTDRELLELAAKANWAGELEDMSIRWCEFDQCINYIHADNQDHNGHDREYRWNPLKEDFDALPLLVKLRLSLIPIEGGGWDVHRYDPESCIETMLGTDNDPRRAIVRAAASLAALPVGREP